MILSLRSSSDEFPPECDTVSAFLQKLRRLWNISLNIGMLQRNQWPSTDHCRFAHLNRDLAPATLGTISVATTQITGPYEGKDKYSEYTAILPEGAGAGG